MSQRLRARFTMAVDAVDLDEAARVAGDAARVDDLALLHEVGAWLVEQTQRDLDAAVAAWREVHPQYMLSRAQREALTMASAAAAPLSRWVALLPEDDLAVLLTFAVLDEAAIADEERDAVAAQVLADEARAAAARGRLSWALLTDARWFIGSARDVIEGAPPEVLVRSTMLRHDALRDATARALDETPRCGEALVGLLEVTLARPSILAQPSIDAEAARFQRSHHPHPLSTDPEARAQQLRSYLGPDSSVLTGCLRAMTRHLQAFTHEGLVVCLRELLKRAPSSPTLEAIVEHLVLVMDQLPLRLQVALVFYGARCPDRDLSRAAVPLRWLLDHLDDPDEASARQLLWRYVEGTRWCALEVFINRLRAGLTDPATASARLLAWASEVLDAFAGHAEPHVRAFAASLWSGQRGANPWPQLQAVFERLRADRDPLVQRALGEDAESALREFSFDYFY